MANVVTYQNKLASIPLADKQVIFCADTGNLYADFVVHGTLTRKQFGEDPTSLENRVAELEGVAERLETV